MVRPIRFDAVARHDVDAAAAWYDERRSGPGRHSLEELHHAVARVAAHPQEFPVVIEGGVRRALLARFPYAVYFVVAADAVDVIAVLPLRRHVDSQDPSSR